MAIVKITIPPIGESITEVALGEWLVADGDFVNEGDELVEVESDKATLPLPAEESGVIKIIAEEGAELEIGAVVAELDTSASAPEQGSSDDAPTSTEAPTTPAANAPEGGDKNYPSPAASKILAEKGIDASSVNGTGKDGRITKNDAVNAKASKPASAPAAKAAPAPEIETQTPMGGASRGKEEVKMKRIRKTIAKRLVEAKNTTAMLTTFNEVDMYNVMELRKKYKDAFKDKHDIGLGFMSFFTKACTKALMEIKGVNAQIDGENIIYHDYADVGIAVSTPKGLVVPVIRNAESLSLAQIEKEVRRLALKGRDGKLTVDEMTGGTFTITNGGVFGSMLSTPIINVPQSAILGMHNIVERPVAVNGQVVIHPVMYLALSYDHRIIDGKESVTFLKMVKEMLEDPARMLLDI
ncbi:MULTISPECIES: 2-oxoglutarate dehydrogenase complex dihydrolipoyllysine-residue succinyltransferase [Halobacteriovorax]|uniref:Dihydrolipoyllysine-residue succinyltransferase component of 2-oxoglutarate dehydrogenase complex n=1 Tax=Halobacteriovorax vibrionivorans TaxID=2152716 RepID=A0ABY0IDG3_9BACT|nr:MULTISPECIES: 2-oxoglutarate dehydrogenase complex dihydrolipoyllysine-residue succinyltransferase [Halobacteriovorax]RZF20984.1 2-oxoglutarate dehydrogenase complex dihydrolipoyllysine-residue succinyltransferase [Halobacteriovorax vibrionivorans]TGD46781.1 2-oxoglutarate dehydrogenase complex dihydrolipoyllysine-residue succinyltransferase [Halobacteriovorax sp. Y22]